MLHLFIMDKEGFMITLNKIGDYHNRQVLEIECLKADEKPIGTIDGLVITNGSKLHELDGDAYEYDEQNKTWVLQPKSSGGADGREIELQKTQTHIQWRYVGTEEWFDLVSLDEISFKHSDFTPEQLQALKGAKGDKGDPGTNGTNGKDGLSIKSTQINDSGHLILTFSDESTKDVGKVTGENGESAYQIAVRLGFHGTEQEWIESLKYNHSEEFTKLAEEVRNTASNIAAERQQITQSSEDITRLKEDLSKLDNDLYRQGRINLFDVLSVVKGKTLSNWAGKTMNDMYNSPDDSVINIIKVSEGDRLIQSIDGVSKGWLLNMCLYDSNGKFVSQNHGTEKLDELIVSKPIPAGIKYVRAITRMTDEQLNKFVIFKYSKGIDLSYLPFGKIEKIKQYASVEIVEKLSKEVETLDTKLNITHRPTVIFQFDDGDEDNRLDLMDEYGLNGCATMTFPVANPSVARNIAKRGYDVFAIYGGKNSDDGLIKRPPDSKDTTVEQWKSWIKVLIDFAKQNGIDRPLTYMCMRSYMYENMLIACKELGINLFRYATLEMNDGTVKIYGWQKNQTIYNTDFFTTRGIQGIDTDISQLKADMEEVIKNKSVYIIFTHKVSDNPRMASETVYMDTHTNRFKTVLSYIKDLKDKGTVDVMSLHDYYNHYKLDGQKDDFYRVLGLMSK